MAEDDNFLYDIFFSYSKRDEEKVRKLYEQFLEAGLRPFFAPVSLSELVGKEGWEDAILKAIPRSCHLAVYCTKDGAISQWVGTEVTTFRNSFADSPEDDHRIFAIADPDMPDEDLNKVLANREALKGVLRPKDASHVLQIMTGSRISSLSKSLTSAQQKLDQTKNLARQSFEYYRHTRFWKPFSEPSGQNLHIFTCGRDTAEDITQQRGSGGRTSIDKWDYQAAVDITHHFARHHRDIGVVIEQPVSKARIDAGTRAFDTAEFSQKLINRNCVIIGSPDVSDFAEITLAKILGVLPYSPGAELRAGVRIRKAGQRFSTFYEQSQDQEPEGVRVIRGGESEFFASEGDRDHGVMILADNPFSQSGRKHKILILAGHSGVATRAMSLLLTHEESWCLETFYDLDQEIAVIGSPLAVVIEVSYRRLLAHDGIGDEREINAEPMSIQVKRALSLKA